MDLLGSLLEDKNPKQDPILPTHLDAPIKDHYALLLLGRKELDKRSPAWERRKILSGREKLTKMYHHLGLIMDDNFAKVTVGFAEVQPFLFSISTPNSNDSSLTESIIAAKKLFTTQAQSLGMEPHLPTTESLLESINSIHQAKNLFQAGVLLTGSRTAESPSSPWKFIKLIEMWSFQHKDLALFIDRNWMFCVHGNKVHVGTREHLLISSDILSQREILLMYARVAAHYKDPTVPSEFQLNKVFEWGDHLLSKYGNRGYELLSSWESLCIGVLQFSAPDPYWDNSAFLQEMMKDFNEWPGLQDEDKCDPMVEFLINTTEINTNLITQLFGLYRIWGHPTVNAAGGIAKLRQHACKLKPVNHTMIKRIECVFKERFCFDYRRQHGKWPNLDTSKLKTTSFLRMQLESNRDLNKKDPRYSMLSWGKVEGLKTFDILPKYNLVKLLSDKAMSLGTKELQEEVKRGTIGPAWKRSVLTKWLESQIGDPTAFLKDICAHGFGAEETVVGVCPKEREMKLWARMFGLLTLKKRMYVVLTEAMLAEHLIPYFPEITMLDSHTTLMKKMYHTTKSRAPGRTSSSIDLFTSMDFQKWNSNMRKEETWEIFKFMDGLFGLENCFTRTHEMFENAQLYLADGTFLPDFDATGKLVEGPLCWSGHLGGIEGLRQKGWTIFTVCIIRYGMEDFEEEFQLMGQGDNQVLKVSFPNTMTPDEINRQQKAILSHLEGIFQQIGPKIKPSESWTSSLMFLYGKYPIFKGCPLSMSLKKMCRMFPFSNEGFPTLESSLSSISANLMAACNSSLRIDGVFFMYLIQSLESIKLHLTSRYLTDFTKVRSGNFSFRIPSGGGQSKILTSPGIKPFYISLLGGNHHNLSLLLLIPRCLGGYPITLLGTLFSNGFPDPVTENICLLKRIYLSGGWRQEIQTILSCCLNSHISSELICEDPVALNLEHPSSPKEILKRLVQSYLSTATWIQNAEFKPFIKLALERQKPLCDHLMTLKPFNPRVAHAIQEATLVGRAIQVVGQLEKTNTLIRMMQQNNPTSITDKITRGDLNYLLSVCYNITTKGLHSWGPEYCSRVWSQQMRDIGWGTPVEGVTVAPIQEAFMIQDLDNDGCLLHKNSSLGYFLAIPSNESLKVWERNLTLGPHDPYIGSQTIEKTQSYGKDLARDSQPVLRNAAKLLTLINWGTEDTSELAGMIKSLFNSLTDIDPNKLIPVSGQIAGSVGHRFLDSATKHGGSISILYSVATFFHLSSNTLTAYKSGAQNVNLHYQALMGICVVWAYHLLIHRQLKKKALHLHVSCVDCITPINEEMMDISPPPSIDLFPSLKGNPICWVSKNSLDQGDDMSECLDSPIVLEPDNPLCFTAFHQRLGQFSASWLRNHTMEAGDNRKLGSQSFQLNMSWVGKIDISLFVDQCLLFFFSSLLYHMDYGQLNSLTSREQFITMGVRLLEQRPKQIFNWAANLYSVPEQLDFLKTRFGGLPLPASVPITLADASSHFSRVLTWRANNWIMSEDINLRIHTYITESSKEIDFHPVFRWITLKLLYSETAEEIARYTQYLTGWKQIFRLAGITYGNHYDLRKCVRQASVFQSEGVLHTLCLKQSLQEMDTVSFVWIQNHIDHLSKQLPNIPSHPESHPLLMSEDQEAIAKLMTSSIVISSSANKKKTILLRPTPIKEEPSKSIHEWRTVRGPTSSWYKLLSCLLNLSERPSATVVCLADGSAGFSQLLARLPGVDGVYYNTLFLSAQAMDQMGPNFIPSAFIGYPNLRKKLISLMDVTEGISDLMDPSFPSQFLDHIQGRTVSLLTCDAEGSVNYDPFKELSLIKTCLELGHRSSTKVVLLKFYRGTIPFLQAVVSLGSSFYKEVRLFRSHYSNQNNQELYLVGEFPREMVFQSSISLTEGTTRYVGWVHPDRYVEHIHQALSSLPHPPHAVVKAASEACDVALQDPWSEKYNEQLLLLWFGREDEYHFPQSFIQFQSTGVDPIRMKKRTRRRGMVNLLKFQRVKKWAMGWLILRRVMEFVNIEELVKSQVFSVVKTTRGWSFHMSVNYDPQHPCTKKVPLSELLTSTDIGFCYSVAGIWRKTRPIPIDNTPRYQKWLNSNSEEPNLPIS